MTDAMLELLPDASVHHLGLFRDSVTLEPTEVRRVRVILAFSG